VAEARPQHKPCKWADILFTVIFTIVMILTVIGHIKMEMDGHSLGTPEAPFIF
jgi:hypothetical protein